MAPPPPLRSQAIIRDGLIRAGDLAKLLGVTTVWLRVLANEGHIPAPDDGYYPLVMTLRRFTGYYRKKVKQKAQRVNRAEIALVEARTRLITIRCDEMEGRTRARR